MTAISIISAALMLITTPLHAVAYLRTPDGEPGVIRWNQVAFEAAPGLWDWGDRQAVYLTYGRVTSVLMIGALLGLVALHRKQRGDEARFERWAFRVFATGFVLLAVGAITEYYSPFLEEAFIFIAIPGLLITLIGGTLLGFASSGRRVIPKSLAIFLALSFIPGVPLMVALLGHIPVGFSLVSVALILVGLRLLREQSSSLVGRT